MGIMLLPKQLKVLRVDPITRHLITSGIQTAIVADESEWDESGEAYLFQESPEDEEEFLARYAEFKKAHEETFDFPAPSAEDLRGLDDTIMAKIEYGLGEDENGNTVLGIEKVIDLSNDGYLEIDEDGHVVPIVDPMER